MRTIGVITDKEKDKLEVEIEMCLQLLYRLEEVFDYREKAISNCVDFLQHLGIQSVSDVIKETEV